MTPHGIHDAADLAALANGWHAPTAGGRSSTKVQIKSVQEVPGIGECGAQQVCYMVEPVLVAGAITGLTGDSGSGKSTLASKLASVANAAGHAVLILDRENPLSVVADRHARLKITDVPDYKHWGGWLDPEAPIPGSATVMTWVASCVTPPLVVVDSLVAFLRGDENSAEEMRGFMDQCRRLADFGAAVVVLHHTGKSETSKEYRGSSDFKAAIDVGFHCFNLSPDMRLGALHLRAFKSRFGFTGEVVYRYNGGELSPDEVPGTSSEMLTEKLTNVIRLHPGIATKEFEDEAVKSGVSRVQARMFMERGLLSGLIRREDAGRNRRRHFLAVSGDENES
jgi:predicted ATP-dependent serine protease